MMRRRVSLPGSLQQLADLLRQDVFVTILVMQEVPEASFGESEPVPGRNVVIAHAGGPGRIQRLGRLLVGDYFKLVAQRHTTQTELDGWHVVPTALFGFALRAGPGRCKTGPGCHRTARRQGGGYRSDAEEITSRCHVSDSSVVLSPTAQSPHIRRYRRHLLGSELSSAHRRASGGDISSAAERRGVSFLQFQRSCHRSTTQIGGVVTMR